MYKYVCVCAFGPRSSTATSTQRLTGGRKTPPPASGTSRSPTVFAQTGENEGKPRHSGVETNNRISRGNESVCRTVLLGSPEEEEEEEAWGICPSEIAQKNLVMTFRLPPRWASDRLVDIVVSWFTTTAAAAVPSPLEKIR